jgi:hypothetical protein
MAYNKETLIMCHSVQLIGWVDANTLPNLGSIGTTGELQCLIDSLDDRTIYWECLDMEEAGWHLAALKEGERVPTEKCKCKMQSNKGKQQGATTETPA